MEKIMNVLEKISNKISFLLFDIAVFSTIIWPFIMVTYIVLRYLGISWLFVEEYTEYWLVLIIFFSISYILKTKGHIYVDIVVGKLPNKYRNVIELITMCLTLFVSLYLLNHSIQFTNYAFNIGVKSSYSSRTLLWPMYAFVPIGLVSFTLEIIVQLYQKIKYFLKY